MKSWRKLSSTISCLGFPRPLLHCPEKTRPSQSPKSQSPTDSSPVEVVVVLRWNRRRQRPNDCRRPWSPTNTRATRIWAWLPRFRCAMMTIRLTRWRKPRRIGKCCREGTRCQDRSLIIHCHHVIHLLSNAVTLGIHQKKPWKQAIIYIRIYSRASLCWRKWLFKSLTKSTPIWNQSGLWISGSMETKEYEGWIYYILGARLSVCARLLLFSDNENVSMCLSKSLRFAYE